MNSAILDPRLGWITLAVLSALWIWLSWLWGRKIKDLDEYALAKRKLGLALSSGDLYGYLGHQQYDYGGSPACSSNGHFGDAGLFFRGNRSVYVRPT